MKKIIALALTVLMMFALVSCGMSADDVKKNLEDADYTVVESPINLDGVVASFVATNGDKVVSVVEFEDKADAKEAYEEAEKLAEEAGEADNFKDLCVRKGKTLITASSKDAMKDAK